MPNRSTATASDSLQILTALLHILKIMRKKIRREYDWKHWERSNSRQQMNMWATHIAVVAASFIFAACL